ncbi:Cupin superfamily protein [Flavobacterium tiangeerense]|uniref:Cupin superfamily protein n=1 Tax=Flavobacterium tiangeerense TaxID=459471 RepID=A0ABY3FNJ1_9FLAO|nr:cupin domain-containing protein [Flavobacterium tiangeerense]TWI03213.1 Cupin superfamily protein [Flavobacterium tiangeerense]
MEAFIKKQTAIKDFCELIDPIGLENFEQNYWENQVLHIQRGNPEFFSNLFSIKDLDLLLQYTRPRGNSIRVVKSQQPMSPTVYENQDGSLNLNQLYAAYADGHTIVVNEIQRFSNPIKELVEGVRQYMGHHVVANLYLTPENEKALSPHYDTHDVFALQISGEKHWILYDDTYYKTPLMHSFQPIFQREHLTAAKEITMKAGDVLYMPRGVPHEAYTTDQSSMHITLGVHSTQWLDFISKAMLSLGQKHIELRKALPLGYLNADETGLLSQNIENDLMNILKSVFEKDNVKGTLDILSEEFRTKEQPKPDGHFSSLDHLNHLDLNTKLIKREGLKSKVTNHVTGARILFQGNTIKGPSQIANTLEFISEQKGIFNVKDIPYVNDDNKVKLAKRLVRGGLLKIVY